MMKLLKYSRNTLIYRMYFTYASQKTQKGKHVLFRQKADLSKISKYIIIKTFSEQLKQKNPQQQTQMFPILCRHYSITIRRSKTDYKINLSEIMGEDYKILTKIRLDRLQVTQLVDIASFFNASWEGYFIDITHPVLQKFVSDILTKILEKQNNNKHTKFYFANRSISYLIKGARCAFYFKMPIFLQYIKVLLTQIGSIDIYKGLSILNFLGESSNNSQIADYQIKILLNCLDKAIQQKWVSFASPHQAADFLSLSTDLANKCQFLFDIKQKLNKITDQTRQTFNAQYQTYEGQQIIRILKILLKINPREEAFKKIALYCFNSIKADGSSSLNPIFILRVIFFYQNFAFLHQLFPNWQQKILNLTKYYFIQNSIKTKLVSSGLYFSLYAGMMSYENELKMYEMLTKIWSYQKDERIKQSTYIRQFCYLYNLSMKYQKFEDAQRILMVLYDISKMFGQKVKSNYLSQVNIQLNEQLFFILGISGHDRKTRKNGHKEINQIQDINSLSTVQYITAIIKAYEPLNMFSEDIKIFIMFYRQTIQNLTYNYRYHQFAQLIPIMCINSYLNNLIVQQFNFLSIPTKHHHSFIQQFSKLYKDKILYAYKLFFQMRQAKNVNSRRSTNQANYFMDTLEHIPNKTKYKFYDNNTIINFLMIFCRQRFMKDIQRIVQQQRLQARQYEYIYIKMLSVLAQNVDNHAQAKQFCNKIMQISFKCGKIFEYFCQIALNNCLARKQQLIEKGKILNIKQLQLNNHKNIHQQSYLILYSILNDEIQQKNYNELIIKYIKLVQAQPQENLNNKVKNYILIAKHCKHNNIILNPQAKSKLASSLYATSLKQQVNAIWIIKSLELALEMKQLMPKLYAKVSKLARYQFQYKGKIKAERLLAVLINYPMQNKWNPQFISALINIVNIFCPDQAAILANELNKIEDETVCNSKVKAYVSYIAQLVNNHGKI